MGIGNGLNRGGTMGVECGTLAVRRGAGTLSRRAGLALGAIAIGVSFLGGTARADDELPVSAITLYRSGVGFFQRQGLVEGDAEVQLRFDADQINDILKSMVVLDLGGGEVGAARYASKEPLERRLSSFAIDVSDNPSIAELMKRLRGAPVKLQTIDGGIEGTIMGVEGRPVVINDQRVEHAFVSLITSKGVRSIDVANVSSFEITDEQLAGELTKALAAMAEHRADNVKAVDLSFHGTGSRRVAVGYVHEMPVWKTSYRLVLPEGTSESGGQPTLQGWAIVENTTDEDWEDVRLSLVAGRPVGFTMDLYEPLFAARPEMPVPFMAGVRPK
ncbi:MAG: hypothetical protein RBS39_10055, partial [Phycisphaerales bacterium]|nr:hypothetical protein [Phycisphaerales bacterium]